MCGFVGAIGQNDVTPALLECLKLLEHRDFDSTGILISHNENKTPFEKCRVSIHGLQYVDKTYLQGNIGIGDTFWLTNEKLHPIARQPYIITDEIGVVKNGIIRNYQTICDKLAAEGYVFQSKSDLELIAHLVQYHLQIEKDFISAIRNATKELEGNFAATFLRRSEPEHLIAVRNGSMLALGLGIHMNFTASDPTALLSLAKEIIYLEDGDIADITRNSTIIYDNNHNRVERSRHPVNPILQQAKNQQYPHIMLKEIYEEPDAMLLTLQGRMIYNRIMIDAFGENAHQILNRVQSVQIVASGSSYHAGLVGKNWLENIAGIPCQIEMSDTYRIGNKRNEPNKLFVTLSQTGEDIQTLASLRLAKKIDYLATLSICNSPESTLVKESDLVLMTGGIYQNSEISSKDFTTQLLGILLLAISLGRYHHVDKRNEYEFVKKLEKLPDILKDTLKLDAQMKSIATSLIAKKKVLFIGENIEFAMAMQGALIFKETSSIYTEFCAASVLKYYPLDMMNFTTVIVLARADEFDTLFADLLRISQFGHTVIVFTNKKSSMRQIKNLQIIELSLIEKLFFPFVTAVLLQLLAYHAGIMQGTFIASTTV